MRDIAGDIMNLDRLDSIVAQLTSLMGTYCLRPELEKIVRELERSPGEKLSSGELWESSMADVANDLFIPSRKHIEPTVVNHIVAQLLSQDIPAWREYLRKRDEKWEADYWSYYER